MRRHLPGLAGICLLALLVGPLALAQDAADPIKAAEAAFDAAETDAERLAIAQDFLRDYPAHEMAGVVANEAMKILSGPMEDPAAAIDLAKTQYERLEHPEAKIAVQEGLLDIYSQPGYGAELEALIGQMYDLPSMSYVDHLAVLEVATKAERWSLVDKHAAAAEPLATPEAFRAAYEDRDFTDEYIEGAGRNRQGLLKTFTGWSAANQGDIKGAKEDFKAAKSLVRKSFFGMPDNDLYLYWGQTLVKDGDEKKGLEMLTLAGLFGADHDAADLARLTWLDLGKNEDDFDPYLWKMRQKHGAKMVDFSAVDYQDASQSFNGLRGKKATLLAFWFPT